MPVIFYTSASSPHKRFTTQARLVSDRVKPTPHKKSEEKTA
jgi:hypothetical protein